MVSTKQLSKLRRLVPVGAFTPTLTNGQFAVPDVGGEGSEESCHGFWLFVADHAVC